MWRVAADVRQGRYRERLEGVEANLRARQRRPQHGELAQEHEDGDRLGGVGDRGWDDGGGEGVISVH